MKHTIVGLENITGSANVVVSNHQSSWETLLLYQLFFPVSPILKKELLSIPFWGWALSLVKPIAIDRSKPREAGRSLLTQGINRIQQGNSIILFPEGSRSESGKVGKFSRSGAKLAIAAKVPIIPIAHNAGDCWPPGQLIKKPGLIKVEIGQPISPENYKAEELTGQVETWVRHHAAVTNTNS